MGRTVEVPEPQEISREYRDPRQHGSSAEHSPPTWSRVSPIHSSPGQSPSHYLLRVSQV